MFRIRKSAVEGDSKKSLSGIETKVGLSKRRLGWKLALWRSTEKKEA